MPTAKVKNVSGEDRTLNGRLVLAGQIIDVPEDVDAKSLTCQPDNWEAVKATQATKEK